MVLQHSQTIHIWETQNNKHKKMSPHGGAALRGQQTPDVFVDLFSVHNMLPTFLKPMIKILEILTNMIIESNFRSSFVKLVPNLTLGTINKPVCAQINSSFMVIVLIYIFQNSLWIWNCWQSPMLILISTLVKIILNHHLEQLQFIVERTLSNATR